MPEADRWQYLIKGLRTGDSLVVADFCRQYADPLERVAKKHLASGLRRRIGPETVVQSVCRTFLRRAQGQEYSLTDSESLWRLLCAITLTKVREKARYHFRQKRDLGLEVHAESQGGEGRRCFELSAPEPTPAEAAEFADQFEHLIAQLDTEAGQILALRLQEFSNEEIAQRLNCSERTVRRVLKRLQLRLQSEVESDS